MKKIVFILVLALTFTNCKNETKQNETTTIDADGVDRSQAKDGLTTLGGEYSYYADAAVLQVGNSAIYGVVLNEKARELHNMGEQYREEPTDGVIVQIRAKIIPKTEGAEGWDYTIDIKEIISVKAPAVKNKVIKIGK